MSVDSLNYLLALGTVALQLVIVVLLAVYFFRSKVSFFKDISGSLARFALPIGLILTSASVFLTLYYSEVLGFAPCPLCWWQRVFLYPLVPLFALALLKRDRKIADYAIVLSVLGLGVALYQHALQMFGEGSLPCPATGGISCAQRFLFEFNYITFPLTAATLFGFLIVLMLFARRNTAIS
jgi:disulfide bond formation protein DsbB